MGLPRLGKWKRKREGREAGSPGLQPCITQRLSKLEAAGSMGRIGSHVGGLTQSESGEETWHGLVSMDVTKQLRLADEHVCAVPSPLAFYTWTLCVYSHHLPSHPPSPIGSPLSLLPHSPLSPPTTALLNPSSTHPQPTVRRAGWAGPSLQASALTRTPSPPPPSSAAARQRP